MKSLLWDNAHKKGIHYWQFPDMVLDDLLKFFPCNQSILDIGCGTGYLIRQLQLRGHRVEGIDNSLVAVSLGNNLFEDGIIRHGDVTNIEIGKYDVIFLKFILAFVEDKNELLEKVKKRCNTLVLVLEVLNFDVAYSEHAMRIGMPENEIEALLKKNFSYRKLFFHEMTELLTERRIYILG